jgi:hypothetical protein
MTGGDSEHKRFADKTCGECARFKVPDSGCPWPGEVSASDKACSEFLEKGSYELGNYVFKVKRDLVLVYEGQEPRYPIKISSLDSLTNRKALAKSLNLEEDNVHQLAAKILEEHSPSSNKTVEHTDSSEAREVEVNAEVKQRAIELLKDPLLLCRISKALHEQLGLVGETKNALLTYLTMISSRLEDPNNLRWSSRASIGKTTIVTKAAQLFPPEVLIIRGGLTKKALYYMPEAEVVDENTRRLDLRGKVLIVLEESESQEFLNEIKPLLSHDVPVLKYSFVEEKVTRKVLLEGWPAYIGITTVPIKGEEHETRTLLASPDRGKEKYSAVIMDDADRHAFPWDSAKPELEPFQQLVRELKPIKVWIPWLPIVAKYFPRDKAGNMRDWKKFRTYIEAVAFLHQYQRPRITINGEEYILALPLDLEITVKIVQGAMAETVLGLERDVKEFYECLAEEKQPNGFTYKELMTIYERHFRESVSKTTLRDRYVEKLEDLGLLEIDDSKKPHKISILPESSASLANFEKAIVEIRLDETKAKIMRKTSANPGGAQRDILENAINEKWCHTLSDFADLFKLLERSKSEEYPEKSLFFDSAKDADDVGSAPTVKNNVKANLDTVQLEDLKAVFWSDQFYDWHPCCICGYTKLTSWKAEDFKGNELWICEDCKLEWEKRRNSVG